MTLPKRTNHRTMAWNDRLFLERWGWERRLKLFAQGYLKRTLPEEVVQAGLLFIHIPKSAGTSICEDLYGRQLGHKSCVDYRRINAEQFERVRKFTVMRNPFTRIYSAYRFLCQGGMDGFPADQRVGDMVARFQGFDDFVLNWLGRNANHRRYVHFIPQSEFITDRAGRVLVDRIGAYEDLDGFLGQLSRDWGITFNIGHMNTTSYGTNDVVWNALTIESRSVLGRLYADDFRLGNYNPMPGVGL